MTLRKIIVTLRSQGHTINFRERKDGSVVITRIDGKSYANKSGNAKARQITGASLSVHQSAQLETIRTAKGHFGHRKSKRAPLDHEVRKALRRAQRIFRGQGATVGKPTTRNIRWVLEHEGKEEALRRLRQAERYAKGVAYPQNVIAFAERLLLDAAKMKGKNARRAKRIASYCKRNAYLDIITEAQLQRAIEALYNGEGESVDLEDCLSEIESIFGI